MCNHTPKDYACSFCLLLPGIKNKYVLSVAFDIFFQDKHISALISSHQCLATDGHALVILNHHFENIYDLPIELGGKIKRGYIPDGRGIYWKGEFCQYGDQATVEGNLGIPFTKKLN